MSAPRVAEWRTSFANTSEQVDRCCSVMRELRPHIKGIDFAARVLSQQKEGYQLAFLELDGVVRSVAGFRILHLLSPDARFTSTISSRTIPTALADLAPRFSIGSSNMRRNRLASTLPSIPVCKDSLRIAFI